MDQTTVKRFQKVQTVFELAVAAPESERASLLDSECASDTELEDEVRAMLDACAAEEVLNVSSRSHPGNCATDSASMEKRRVGPYEIDRLLGRGGTGSVYLAHRADGQFDQKVAIKLIDLPVGSHLFRERFRQERQILAGLQHPYIARLLNGGITAEGCPFLAMEYVDGVPIHRFCEQQSLSELQRLELFLRVCDAVQFAHQNFVVHRDLKPDNILVAADGTPRLLDFGTAKLVSPTQNKRDSELTRAGYLSYTPQYASPEQVLGKPITAATDTYALGVLLFLLLTGNLPYQLAELTTAEMLRAICDEAPIKPLRLYGKRLDGDLEAILLKALRKEPQERYATVEQLSEDLRAYLDGHPVGARRGTMRYKAVKFARRHSLVLGSALVLATTLAAGIVAVGWQAGVANRERRKAEARSADLRQLNTTLLSELDDAIQELPGSTGAQKLLVTRVLEHLDRMAKDAEGDRQTQLDLVTAYTRLADLQGNSYHQNLGDTQGALNSIGKAIALAQTLAGPESKDREAIRALASAQISRSEIMFGTAPIEEAIAATQAAIASFDRLIPIPGVTAAELCQAGGAQALLGDELGINDATSLNDPARALIAYRKDLELINRAAHIDPNIQTVRWDLIIITLKIAQTEAETDPAQAIKDVETALDRIVSLPTEEQQALKIVRVRQDLLLEEADSMVQVGKDAEANSILTAAVGIHKKLITADPQDSRALFDLVSDLNQQAQEYELEADPDLGVSPESRKRNLSLAASAETQEIDLMGQMLKRSPSEDDLRILLADSQVHLATIQSTLRIGADSSDLAKRGLAGLRDLISGKPGIESAGVLDSAAQDFMLVEPESLRNPQLALTYAERAAGLSQRKRPAILLTLAKAYRATGQPDKSRATANEGLALLAPAVGDQAKPVIRRLLQFEATK